MKKTVLITGGTMGIGLATAKKFAQNDYIVNIVARNPQPEADEIIKSTGGTFFKADVSDFKRAREVVNELVSKYQHIYALINSAGISKDASLAKMDEETWDAVIDIDLKGTFNYTSACIEHFKRQNYGKVVNVSSTLALRARFGVANYVAAKAGVHGFTQASAIELARYNVNVNCVCPGFVETRVTANIPEDVKKDLISRIPLKRPATPDDIAGVIYFLCTDDASYITGTIIRVDGGLLA